MTDKLLIAYYGDDFTGSTDVLESLASQGIETVLFTRIPDEEQRGRFAYCRAVGLAGTSRSQTPDWMDRNLPAIFSWLGSLNASIVHYKVCSTFDSASHRGSIGRAAEIGAAIFDQSIVPIVIGAPQLGRYTVFGQLFAAYNGEVFRIDRHPVMSRHPVTPMKEADLVLHLGRQTDLPVGRVDLADLQKNGANEAFEAALRSGIRIVLVDVYDAHSQAQAGELLMERLGPAHPFVIGSSGVEYALIPAWRRKDVIGAPPPVWPLEKADRVAVISGSCSPVTETQIQTALNNGFTGVALDYGALATGQGAETIFEQAREEGRRILKDGGSPIFYTALGPNGMLAAANDHENDRVGRTLGRLLQRLANEHSLMRMAVAGGDTSSHALSELNIYALTLRHPIAQSPGSPVCTGHREGLPEIEIVLKGGQIGKDDYFIRFRDGTF
jgi:uncharacterized protein YgbK (DUF1537 family)